MFAAYYRSKIIKGFEVETRKAYEEASESAAEAIKVRPSSYAILAHHITLGNSHSGGAYERALVCR